jgi:hypothetical protein
MTAASHDRALDLAAKFRAAGFPVARVVIDGKRVEVILRDDDKADPFDTVDLRRKP